MKCCLKKHESDLSQFSLIFFFCFVNLKNVFSLARHNIGLWKQIRKFIASYCNSLDLYWLEIDRLILFYFKGVKVIETSKKTI